MKSQLFKQIPFIAFWLIALIIAPVISAQGTTNCGDNPPTTNPASGLVWHAFCDDGEYGKDPATQKTIYCSAATDCPLNSGETGVNKANSSWCYQFSNGPHCLQLRSISANTNQSADFQTPKELFDSKVKQASSDHKQISFGGINLGSNPILDRKEEIQHTLNVITKFINDFTSAAAKSLVDKIKELTNAATAAKDACNVPDNATQAPQCLKDADKKLDDAKTSYRLAQMLDLFSEFGKENRYNECVYSDFGITPHLKARAIAEKDPVGDGATPDPACTPENTKNGNCNRAIKGTETQIRLETCIGNTIGNIKWRVKSKSGDRTRISIEDQQKFPPIYFKTIPSEDLPALEGINKIVIENDAEAEKIRKGDLTPLYGSPLKEYIDNYYCPAVKASGLKGIPVCGV